MRLGVVIPCLNEAATLPGVLDELPRAVPGFSAVDIVVVDDGSTDDTAAIARSRGAHVVRFAASRGLVAAQAAGLDAVLRRGAGVVVFTDGDGQYDGAELPALVAPIARGDADLAIGDRGAAALAHFSFGKRVLQRLGSWVTRVASGTPVADAPSGFRAMSRDFALHVLLHEELTPTIEAVVLAGDLRRRVANVAVTARPTVRPSRVVRSVPRYVASQAAILVRALVRRRPLRSFLAMSAAFALPAAVLLGRFGYFHVTRDQAGHTQSVVVAAALGVVSAVLVVAGVLADLVAANRRLSEELLVRIRRLELERR